METTINWNEYDSKKQGKCWRSLFFFLVEICFNRKNNNNKNKSKTIANMFARTTMKLEPMTIIILIINKQQQQENEYTRENLSLNYLWTQRKRCNGGKKDEYNNSMMKFVATRKPRKTNKSKRKKSKKNKKEGENINKITRSNDVRSAVRKWCIMHWKRHIMDSRTFWFS